VEINDSCRRIPMGYVSMFWGLRGYVFIIFRPMILYLGFCDIRSERLYVVNGQRY
jgi:hypothetical protein